MGLVPAGVLMTLVNILSNISTTIYSNNYNLKNQTDYRHASKCWAWHYLDQESHRLKHFLSWKWVTQLESMKSNDMRWHLICLQYLHCCFLHTLFALMIQTHVRLSFSPILTWSDITDINIFIVIGRGWHRGKRSVPFRRLTLVRRQGNFLSRVNLLLLLYAAYWWRGGRQYPSHGGYE